MFGAGRTRARKPALTKARLPMQNLLHLRVARAVTTALVGRAVLCPPHPEFNSVFSCTKSPAPRNRARKGAESLIQT